MHLGECRGFVVNTVAMTYQIKKKNRELARIADSIISLAIEVGPILRLFTVQNVPGFSIKMGSLHSFLSPSTFEN